MILEGVKLLIIGMGTVYLFLLVQIGCMQLVSYLNREAAQKELVELEKAKQARARAKAKTTTTSQGVPTAVLAAAIQAYENDKN